MRLAVFGATGPTGLEVVQQALAQGHDVTALVRDPDKMAALVPNKDLKIEKMDFSSADTVEPHLQDKDVVLSCLGNDPSNPPFFLMRWIIKPLFLGRVLANMAQMEKYLQECGDINFTVVRPPHLTMGPVTDMQFCTEEGPQVLNTDGMRGMCRADVARFMLSTMSSEEWLRKCVAVIAVPKK
ncbi:flavin reductase (NADPH)-like isoform X2 [Branchiostoma floridae]|uniref:Flavin reductase (NADPH)-like isoform X2 n=1 Tax=Branchiostoma floridae TaxID=7739 RepID=A0A9J7LUM1_BRAFL|nr:flavin reductase (NADPH)-like isoform X2 [Branchiostoma floridae]